MGNHKAELGFTLVEVYVAIVLMVLFIAVIAQLFQSSSVQDAAIKRQIAASNYAQANLTKFDSKEALPSYTCDTQTGGANRNNLALNPNAPGDVVLTGESSNAEDLGASLINPSQEVRAFTPSGCDNSSLIKLVSTVHYGNEATRKSAIHVKYVK